MPCTGSLLATLLDSVPQNREGISCLGNARGKNHFRPCGRERDAMHYCKRLRTEPRVANSVPQQNGISCLLETRGKNYFQKDHVPVEENVMPSVPQQIGSSCLAARIIQRTTSACKRRSCHALLPTIQNRTSPARFCPATDNKNFSSS